MTYEELLDIAFRAEGHVLRTVTGREFTVGVYRDCPFFTPRSTGQGRTEGRTGAERFLAKFNEIRSFRPADYRAVSRDATYLVALVAWAEES